MVIGVEEVKDLDLVLAGGIGLDDTGCHLPDEEGGGGLVAVVDLVPHLDRLGDQVLEIDGAVDFQGFLEDGIKGLFHPLEMLNHFGAIGAKAEDLAQAFVLGTVGKVALGLVFDDENRHGGRDDTGHGAHGIVVVAGIKLDLA